MSLEGAKIICLNNGDPDQNEIISAHGRTFKFGYYMDCDVVLEHPDAMGLQCTIDCDAFGRVTIENRCPDQTVTLNGNILKKMRPLLHNTEICIFEKKFLWQFEGNPKSAGFQMEDINDFTTPCKQIKKAEQPPNSEPARRWRTQFHKRLTIHSFAYCIKANESPKDVEITTDENKPLNTYERIISIDSEPASGKRLSPSPPPIAADLIDLKTPKTRQKSLTGQRTPISCCKLSETVITSYSPRETGIRLEKSFGIVQSPAATPTKLTGLPDVSLGTFKHLPSPLTQSHRPSMHLIDLTTPNKRVPPFSPVRTLLKSTLKKNITSTSVKPQQLGSIANTTTTSMESVYSVHSTDNESVIELSDEGSFSPSPVPKTPLRKTPQSLMKHAILSSAKKAAITKRLHPAAKPTPSRLMLTPPGASGVRFQSQSTPQRKSLGRSQSPSDSHKSSHSVAGKAAKPIFTSTPFRGGESTTTKRSILLSPSTSLTGIKNKSRTSLMLKHALLKSPQTSSERRSVSFIEATKTSGKSPAIRARKSVSFLDRIESEGNQSLNQTFSIEEENEAEPPRKVATFSPEKEKCKPCQEISPSLPIIVVTNEKGALQDKSEVCQQDKETEKIHEEKSMANEFFAATPYTGIASVSVAPANDNVAISSEKNSECFVSHSQSEETVKAASDTVAPHPADVQTTQSTIEYTNVHEPSALQTPQSSRGRCKEANASPTQKLLPNMNIMEDDDFEGLDAIFKTPKAKNLMILGSPKSISLQKPTPDSVELIHSTEFDLSPNLDDIFRTPQSEFITNRVEGDSTPAGVENMESYSPEDAFDMLVGRPITRKTYANNKTTPPKQDLPPLNVSRDNSLPKTDIEEWIDSVHDSIKLLDEDDEDEDEMSCLTATQSDFSRDPLMTSSMSGSASTTNRKKCVRSAIDETVMTIQEDDEEGELDNVSALKDPLEMTTMSSPKKPLSPNISGIDLLDHTSESLFSETLAVSDESSGKETDKTIGGVDNDREDEGISHVNRDINISPDKARREMEEAFKNFENERKILEGKRLVSTPEPTKPVARVNRRKTLGNQQTLHAYFDAKGLKKERDMKIAFENFKEEATTVTPRVCKTPEVSRVVRNEMRKTLGNPVEGEFDVNAIKAEREMELAFENFNAEPGYTKERTVQTPEPEKVHFKDHRRTMGSGLVTELALDLKAIKAERELELALENFEEKPQFSEKRSVQTPEPEKTTLKANRRTMGSKLVSKVTLDLKAAKAERELELAFENFDDEPVFSEERISQTPKPKKSALKDHRRTMGSNLVSDVMLDLEAAKAQLEIEQAFENFEDEPEFSEERTAKTPEPKKPALKDHRRTMGSNLMSEVTLDLEVEKAQLELEQAFENFEDKPEFSQERTAKTPEPKKLTLKDNRRTMGSSLVSEVTLDLEAAKAQLEIEQAFENFEDEPEFSEERAAKTPEPKKPALKDHRRTMGSNLVSEVTLDLEAAKAQLEIEQAFENFEDEPEFSEERAAKTPEPKKPALKDHRRTMGSSLVSEVTLDLEAAKAQLEIEQAFENFEDEPEFSEERAAKTPEPKKPALKDHRRTMGSNLVSEVTLDLEAAKAQLEIEQAFENFEDEPEFSEERTAKTPEPKKPAFKDHRRTMGNNLVSEVTLDLEAAKAQLELEQAFENFEDEPEFSEERTAKTPEPKKLALKDHRRTMGSNLVSEVTLDLEAAKAQLELEQAFENFEDEPEFSEERTAKTPEPKKPAFKDHRRTMGNNLVSEVTLDLKTAKAQLELEQAFENFEDEPEFSEERTAITPQPKKPALKDHRRTMGSNLESEVILDLEAEKAQLELEQAFENFEDEPEFSKERAAKTPEARKPAVKEHRRTMGSNLVSEVTLDLEAAKAQLELDQAFENFEDEPEFSQERAANTPELKKPTLKDKKHRRTMGSNLVSEVTLDVKTAKAQLEIEQALENLEKDPSIRKQNELPSVMKISNDGDACETNEEVVGVSDSDAKSKPTPDQKSKEYREEPLTKSEASSRKRQLLIDEENKCKEEVISQAPLDELLAIQPRTRRRRQNTIDEVQQPRPNSSTDKDDITTTGPTHPKSRRRRQPTIDDLEQLRQQEEGSNLVDPKTPQMHVRTRRGRQNSVDVSNLKDVHESVPPPTVDDASQIGIDNGPALKRNEVHEMHQHEADVQSQTKQSANTPRKLHMKSTSEDDLDSSEADSTTSLRKKVIAIATHSEAHHQLEPIAEEHKKLVTPQIDDGEAKSETKPVRRYEDDPREKPTPKSLLNLKAEVDEISSTPNNSSTNRIRGRRAQLSVVLLESKNNSSPAVDSQHVEEVKMEADEEPELSVEDKNGRTAARNDIDEVIPCTPAPTKTRVRRPARKGESAEAAAPAPRRGRRGSVQQDVDVKVDEGYVEQVVSTTPLPTKTRGRKANLKVESSEGNSTSAANLVPSTPDQTKPRVRRAALKVESIKTTTESSTPNRNRGRQGQDVIPTESMAEVGRRIAIAKSEVRTDEGAMAQAESLIEEEARTRSIEDIEVDTDKAAVVLKDGSLAQTRKKGRRKAVADPEVSTKDAAVAPTVSVTDREQMGSVGYTDTHITKTAVPPTVETAPVRKRGRKKVVPDTDLLTDDANVPSTESGAEHITSQPKRSRRSVVEKSEDHTGEVATAPTESAVEDADAHTSEIATPPTESSAAPRKRGRKRIVDDLDRLKNEALAPNTAENTERRGIDVRKSNVHVDEIVAAPTESAVEETDQLEFIKYADAHASEISVPESLPPPRKRGRKKVVADLDRLTDDAAVIPIHTMGDSVAPALETNSVAHVNEPVESVTETSAPALKRGRKRAVLDPNTHTESPSVVTRRAGRRIEGDHLSPLNVKPIAPSAGTSKPLSLVESTTKDSIIDDDIQADVEEVVPSNLEPPKKRGRKPKLAVSVSETLTPDVSQSTQVPLKIRGRRGALKSESVDTDVESLTPAQKGGRKRAVEEAQTTTNDVKEEVEDSAEDSAVQLDQTDLEEVVQSTPVPLKPRGRRPALKAEPIRPTSSTPVRGRGRRGAEIPAQEPIVAVKIEPTTESANAVRKRGRRGAGKEAPEEEIAVDVVKSEPIEPADNIAHAARKRGRRGIVESEVHTEEDDAAKAVPSKQRRQDGSTTESTKLLVGSTPNNTEITEQEVLSKKRGRAAAVKSEPTPESSTPIRRRGRKGALKEDVHSTEPIETSAKGVSAEILDLEVPPSSSASGPPRARGRPAKLMESAAESVTPTQRRGRKPINKSEEESTDSTQTPVKPEVKSNSRPIRSRRASAKEVSEEEPIASAEEKLPPVSEESDTKSQKKPIRGRKALPKKDATVESTTSHTDEEQPASPIKTKTTRGRKPTVKPGTSSTKEKTQVEDTKPTRGRKANPVEARIPSEDEVESTSEPNKNTTRNKMGAQIESLISEANQPTSATKKTTRGRKAAAKDSDDEHSSQSDTQKNPTRSQKVAQDEKPLAKRTNQRNVETIAADDQQYTPSKRIRRKPNLLLSDEFVH